MTALLAMDLNSSSPLKGLTTDQDRSQPRRQRRRGCRRWPDNDDRSRWRLGGRNAPSLHVALDALHTLRLPDLLGRHRLQAADIAVFFRAGGGGGAEREGVRAKMQKNSARRGLYSI